MEEKMLRMTLKVDEENLAVTMGSGSLMVLATPAVVALMEGAAAELAQQVLDNEDYTTVGTMINIEHISPTPIGAEVEAVAVLKEVDGRNFYFEVSASDRQERIEKYAEDFGIMSSLGDLISSYSHGMKQKLAIISALVHEPKLLILDEPFVGLDPQAAVVLKNKMREICEKGGAIFFSTHVLDVAEKLCNKVAIIKDGTLIKTGDMDDVVKEGISLEDIFMEVVGNEQ